MKSIWRRRGERLRRVKEEEGSRWKRLRDGQKSKLTWTRGAITLMMKGSGSHKAKSDTCFVIVIILSFIDTPRFNKLVGNSTFV